MEITMKLKIISALVSMVFLGGCATGQDNFHGGYEKQVLVGRVASTSTITVFAAGGDTADDWNVYSVASTAKPDSPRDVLDWPGGSCSIAGDAESTYKLGLQLRPAGLWNRKGKLDLMNVWFVVSCERL